MTSNSNIPLSLKTVLQLQSLLTCMWKVLNAAARIQALWNVEELDPAQICHLCNRVWPLNCEGLDLWPLYVTYLCVVDTSAKYVMSAGVWPLEEIVLYLKQTVCVWSSYLMPVLISDLYWRVWPLGSFSLEYCQ